MPYVPIDRFAVREAVRLHVQRVSDLEPAIARDLLRRILQLEDERAVLLARVRTLYERVLFAQQAVNDMDALLVPEPMLGEMRRPRGRKGGGHGKAG